jgi:Protein of unknown function (DUF3768)
LNAHGEHDFGSFTLAGRKFFWKIDYYDKELRYGSENPADPAATTRVLTLMLASEYRAPFGALFRRSALSRAANSSKWGQKIPHCPTACSLAE